MLTHLSIRHIVIIEKLDLSFDSGLTVLSGETGAGKSILLDSMSLILGAKAQTDLIRKGEEQASVTASFSFKQNAPIFQFLHANDIETSNDGTLIVRRIINQNGNNKIFLNDSPISASLLKGMSKYLVDIHGQFDTHQLLNEKNHQRLIDIYGHHEKLLNQTEQAWKNWRNVRKELIQKQKEAQSAAEDEEYLRHVLEELRNFGPQDGEQAELENQRTDLRNQGQINEALSMVDAHINGDGGVDEKLNNAVNALHYIADKLPDDVKSLLENLETVQNTLSDGIFSLSSIIDSVQNAGSNLDHIEKRLMDLKHLARKHECHGDDLLKKMETFEEQLSMIDQIDEIVAKLKKQEIETKTKFIQQADALYKQRVQTAQTVDQLVMKELPPLKMENAVFKTNITKLDEDQWNAQGTDYIAFEIATNPGSHPGALSKVASGGELSRLMLALKSVLATTDPVGTLIFDEVDSGIGGKTAHSVGERLADLSSEKQVMVITHSPQVAAKGDQHFYIFKETKNGLTKTKTRILSDKDRLEEIARMLSGASITDEARSAARTLLSDHEKPMKAAS